MKKGKINKKLAILITTLLIGLSITLYITYAYYVAEITGNEQESTVAIKGGNLVINYEKNSGNIVASDIFPGWEETKTFTVSCSINYGDKTFIDKVWYDVLLIVEENQFLTGSLEYSLNIINADNTKEGIFSNNEYHDIETGSKIEGITLGSGYLLNEEMTHTYNLKIRYVDRDDVDQTSEMDAKFSARVNVRGSEQTIVTVDLDGGTLSNFSLDSINKSKIAKSSEIYIPAPVKVGYGFSGWKIVNGTGTSTGNNLLVTSSNITIKALYGTPSFANDSWATIAANVRAGQYSNYNVGDTKEIAIDGFTNTESGSNGLYTVRIANNTTPSECNTEGFSQTACGFVIEFVDIITNYIMNPAGTYNGIEYPTGTNLGGWPASAMYKFINGDTSDHMTYDSTSATVYSKLTSDLRDVIIDTTVISGHGSADENTSRTDGNWQSIDKLYLLSFGEIYSDCLTRNCWDFASCPINGSGATTTRQLDYYNGVTMSANYERAFKQLDTTVRWWWLRAAAADQSNDFKGVYLDGTGHRYGPKYSAGVAPAFRIG